MAKTFFDAPRLVNEERGMLGYTGSFEGRPISVQSTGMGCPSAAIVTEELIQLGATRLLRIGTCGGLQPHMALGDTVVAVAATPFDRTAAAYTADEPHAPTADWRLVDAALRIGRDRGLRLHVGPIVSNSVFYDPDSDRNRRFAERGHLGVEMESAVLFTIAALRKVSAGTILTVSDTLLGERIVRIGDDELRKGVDQMMELAARVAIADLPET